MAKTLIDANVLIDLSSEDPRWVDWSAGAVRDAVAGEGAVINPIVYAEVAAGYPSRAELDARLPAALYERQPLPWEAAHLAGQCFVRYRRAGGTRRSPLPDFFVGAHAQVAGLRLLTRDAGRYRTYFPGVELITPEP